MTKTPFSLPDTAFDIDSLDLPTPLLLAEASPDSAERRLQWAARLMMIGARGLQELGRSVDVEGMMAAVTSIDSLDALAIDVATERLAPASWTTVAEILASFSERSIPRLYQGRDRRIPALAMYLHQRPEAEADPVLSALIGACRCCDGALYNAILANLEADGVLESLATQVVGRLEEDGGSGAKTGPVSGAAEEEGSV